MTVITAGTYTLTPTLVLGYSATRTSNSVVHTIIGRPAPVVTLRPAMLRSGTLELFFPEKADAFAALDAHAQGSVLRLVDGTDEREMRYVLAGNVSVELETETYTWKVSADFQEVAP